jgi:4-hydroxybenzoate polyprenyltransferase
VVDVADASHEPPLFVDLDGALIKTDLVLESLLALIKAAPWTIALVPLWLVRGRAYLRAAVARRANVAAELLVYDEQVLARLRAERERGRRLVLTTASSASYAEAVAQHLGLFDGVLAGDGARRFEGERRLDAILARAAGPSFDYIGHESADLPIWRKARKAICAGAPPSVMRRVRAFTEPDELARPRRSYPRLFVRALRVHQWLKNALVIVPLVAAHRVRDVTADLQVVAAFIAYSLCASSVYVLNDLMDLPADRQHPRKRQRPFASGELPLAHGLVLSPALLALGVAIAATLLPRSFLIVLATYYVASMAYNFAAKELAVWDVVLLAGLYVLRVVAGAAAVPVPLSFWLLAFSGFVFLSLALAKRYSEMYALHKLGRPHAHGRGYLTDDMPVLQSMGVASGYLAVLVMALYINSPEIHRLYVRPYALWAICPLLIFWISRIWVKTHRGQMHDDPVVFALRDGVSLVVGALTIACVVAGTIHL